MIEQPKNKLLNESLNGWPDETLGNKREEVLITRLNDLCKEFGYGRVPQVAEQIEDFWRNPECAEKYKKSREARLTLLKDWKEEL